MIEQSVTYKQFITGKKPVLYRNHACFSSLGGTSYSPKPNKVTYLSEIHNSLTKEQMNFWLNFMASFLDKKLYKYRFIKSNYIFFKLNSSKLNRNQTLLYLTGFRYVKEMVGIIQELFKFKDFLSLEELFIKFQTIHFELSNGKIKLVANGGGHRLMYEYYWESSSATFKPITLTKFKENLDNKTINKVYDFFK